MSLATIKQGSVGVTERLWNTQIFQGTKKKPTTAIQKATEVVLKVLLTIPAMLVDPIYFICRSFYNLSTMGYVIKEAAEKRHHTRAVVTTIAGALAFSAVAVSAGIILSNAGLLKPNASL